MTTEKALQNAIATGEILDVIYLGGSNPGTSRRISPISISNGKVKARCIKSNTVKSFSVSKILLSDEYRTIRVNQSAHHTSKKNHFNSLADLLKFSQDTLKGQGWHVIADETSISLHGLFKNGKAKKTADVAIHYEEYAYDYVIDENGEEHLENKRKRKRPWVVRAKSEETKTYGSLERAAETFMKLSNKKIME